MKNLQTAIKCLIASKFKLQTLNKYNLTDDSKYFTSECSKLYVLVYIRLKLFKFIQLFILRTIYRHFFMSFQIFLLRKTIDIKWMQNSNL